MLDARRGDRYLRKRLAAQYLGWSVRKLENYLSEIPHYRHGGMLYFRVSALDAYMQRFEVEPAPDLHSMADEVLARLGRAGSGKRGKAGGRKR